MVLEPDADLPGKLAHDGIELTKEKPAYAAGFLCFIK